MVSQGRVWSYGGTVWESGSLGQLTVRSSILPSCEASVGGIFIQTIQTQLLFKPSVNKPPSVANPAMDGPGQPVLLAEDLQATLTGYIQDCYRHQRFCDLNLRGAHGRESVSCHRCVLAAVFPPIKGLLDTPDAMVDLVLPDFPVSGIRELIDRIYLHLNDQYLDWTDSNEALASTLMGYFPPILADAARVQDDGDEGMAIAAVGTMAKIEQECQSFQDRLALGSEEADQPLGGWDSSDNSSDGPALNALFQAIRDQDHEGDIRPAALPKRAQSQRRRRWAKRPPRKASGMDGVPGVPGVPARGPRGRKKGSGLKAEAKRFKTVTHLDHSNFENLEALKNTLKCDCPGMSLNNLKEQQNHFYSVHCQNEFTICDTCGHPVRTYNIQAHRESCASEVGPFLCPECGKEFPRRCNLNSHVFSYHKHVKCKSCGEQFVGNMLKRIHERTQHVKSFNCDHCPLQFNTMLKKKSHMVSVHLPDHLRPHVCLDCGQGFLYEDKLKRHRMNKHIRSRPFACRCGCVDVAYNDQSTRNQHENRNHPDHPIVVDRMTNKVPRSKPKVRTTS
eukprot:TCALIF_08103-PA protein Name:"Similar to Zinc finger protein ZFMSA12A (Micropterus salmoides)" AED:0.28 eAED:0.28 QI:0/0/0/0.5/1/1/2/0/561